MVLKQYLKGRDRALFAAKIGTTKNYINLLTCGARRPSPDLALLIEMESEGAVNRMELLFPKKLKTKRKKGEPSDSGNGSAT